MRFLMVYFSCPRFVACSENVLSQIANFKIRNLRYTFPKRSRVESVLERLVVVKVRATNLRHAYGDRITLNGVSFELASGDRVALTGRNGDRKSVV